MFSFFKKKSPATQAQSPAAPAPASASAEGQAGDAAAAGAADAAMSSAAAPPAARAPAPAGAVAPSPSPFRFARVAVGYLREIRSHEESLALLDYQLEQRQERARAPLNAHLIDRAALEGAYAVIHLAAQAGVRHARRGDGLVERAAAGDGVGADVGQPERLEHAADGAVLAGGAVQQRHDAGRPVCRERGQQRGIGVEDVDLPAGTAQRLGHPASGAHGDVTLGGQAPCEDDDARVGVRAHA